MQKKREPKNSPSVKRETGKAYLLVGVSLVVVVLLVFLIINYAPGQFAGKAIEKPVQCIAAPSGIVTYWDMSEKNFLVGTEGTKQLAFAKDLIGPKVDNLLRTAGIAGAPDSGVIGPDQIVQGKIGQALLFDGIDDVLYFPDSPTYEFGGGDFTMEGWIKVEDLSVPQVIALKGDELGYNFILGKTVGCVSGNICFRVHEGSMIDPSKIKSASADAGIVLNQWTHIAAVRSGSEVKFFINGVLIPGESDTFGTILDDKTYFSLGAGLSTIIFPDAYGHFKGAIDEFAIYKRALTAEEIKALYGAGVKGIGKCLSEVDCTNGLDDDADGNIDCEDVDCQQPIEVSLSGEYEVTIAAAACPGATVTIK